MFRTGKSSKAISDRHEFNMTMTMCQKKDVLFLISKTGDTEEILDGIEFAKKRCTVVLITQNRSESLKESVDYIIYLPIVSDKIENIDFMWNIVQLCTISKWFDFYVAKHEEEIKKIQDRVTASISLYHESLK